MPDESAELLRRYQAGDDRAADALYRRYVERLTALARRQLSAKVAQRVDPEDVVQSAYRSFFVRAREGEYQLQRGGDLWRLLAAITWNKSLGQIERHTAAQRAVGRETPLADPVAGGADCAILASRDPSPADVASVSEELARVMAALTSEQRTALEMRLQAYTFEEIAAHLGRAERTVRRWLDDVRRMLSECAE